MRTPQRLVERAAILIWMLVQMSVVHTLLSPRITENDLRQLNHQVDLPVAAFNLLADVVLGVLLIPRFRRTLGLIFSLRPVLVFCILAFASVLWSSNPPYTLRRAITLSITILAATYFGQRYSVNDLGRIFGIGVLGLIVLSLLAFLVHPQSVMDVSHPGDWMGLAEHKNVFGGFIALGICCLLLTDFGKWSGFRIPCVLLSVVMLFLSHSASAWLACSIVVLATPVLLRLGKSRSAWLPSACILAAVFLISYAMTNSAMSQVLLALGKDPTLTGRTQLWQNLIGEVAQRPLLGYGYEAFFSSSSQLLTLQDHATWLPPSAHNGYLQVLVDNGIVGEFIVFWFILSYMRSAFRYARQGAGYAKLLPVTLGVFWLLHNCVEVTLFEGETLISFAIFALFASLRSNELSSVPDRSHQLQMVPHGQIAAFPNAYRT